MAQPKLSNQSIQPLLAIGPLDGLDATSDPLYVGEKLARDLTNFVPNHAYQGLAPIRGRLAGTTRLASVATSLAIYYPKNNTPQLVACVQSGVFQRRALANNSGNWKFISVPEHDSNSVLGVAGAFAQYASWLFFSNGDPNALAYKFDKDFNATFWGIARPGTKPNVTVTSPSDGMIYGSAYYYRYTYSSDMPDASDSQESSPSAPAGPFDIGTALSPPGSGSATIGQTPAPTLSVGIGGSIPDGTYIVGTTWVTAAGEEGLSVTAQITISGGGGAASIGITPQSPPGGATGWNVYTGTTANALTQQNGTRSGTGAGVELAYTTTGGPPPAFTGFLNPPATPILKSIAGGSLPARTEYYQVTYLNGQGETVASQEASIYLIAGNIAVVESPLANANATSYNVYGSTTSAQEILQNASPITLGTNWTEPTTGLILGQSATLVAIGSDDPQVTEINFYRIGGQALGNWYLVGSIPNAPGPQTFTDNTPDSGVTGQAMVLHRDPPAPFNVVFSHAERMIGFGYNDYTGFDGTFHSGKPCDMWYSNYNEPWGFDNTNQVLPVGATDAGDVAVQGASLSSIAILWKSKTTWALYGSSPSDFFVQKLFDVGAVSPAAAFVALGVAFWLSRQGLYMFDGATLTYLSKPVKAIIDSFSDADLQAACGCFDDRMAWWSFPTQGIALGYDTVSQLWFKGSLTSTLFAFDTEGHSRPAAPDYVFGYNPDNIAIDQWFADTQDLGEPITATLTTRTSITGPQIGTYRVRFIELVTTSNLGPDDQVTVTVTANPATTARSFSKAFKTSPVNLRQRSSVPAGIQGDELQLEVSSTTSDGLVLAGIAAHGWIRRLYNVVN